MNIEDKFGVTLAAGCAIGASPPPCTVTPTPGPTGFLTLSAGPTTVCGMHNDGVAYCGNGSGQLGSEVVSKSMVPVVFSLNPDTAP